MNPKSFGWEIKDRIATITLSRPEKKNPLTFEAYAELVELFRQLAVDSTEVKVVIITGAGGNFCSGGDVNEIIGPLVDMRNSKRMDDLLSFTRMTGDVVKSMRNCPQPIIAAIDGACVGAGAILAMASDMRIGTARSKVAFLFTKVGLSGADMGACAILPRIIGQGRASELLFTGRTMSGEDAFHWGFYNSLVEPEELQSRALDLARDLGNGPTFAHGITKKALHQEWSMGVDEAIEAEAQAQAICMQSEDFVRAYHAFVAKQKPVFEGN